MPDIPLTYAKDHLEDLIERARRGEVVTIDDGEVRLALMLVGQPKQPKRYIDTLPPFVPLAAPRKLGLFQGEIPLPPDDFFDPLDADDLKLWYGEDA